MYQSVVVKGLERNISCLYEARRLLLGLDSCETAKVTEMTPDPTLAGSELTNYWLNMLLQQLRLSEQGEHICISVGVFRVGLWKATVLRNVITSYKNNSKGIKHHYNRQ